MTHSFPLLVALSVLFLASGCKPPGPKSYPVSGTVTLDGQPLAEGNVYFKTLAEGLIDPLPVKDGKFEGKAGEGQRRVEIVAYRMVPVPGEMGGEVPQSLIAPRFNSQSELTAEVTAAGPNVYDFKVESK
jgi:hypothetical protein